AGALVAATLEGPPRMAVLALALLGAGWLWGGFRLDALDRSVLVTRIGHVDRTLAEVAAPARHGQFALRLMVEVRTFGSFSLNEPALLELPLGRAPPQGAVIETVAEVKPPRPPENGFDERAWLGRQGVHVVLHGRAWSQIGRRHGIGGLADGLRRFVRRGIAPGLKGERATLIAGVVLGSDESLSKDLQDRFRRSGLYHLLAVSGQNVAIIAGAILLLAALAGIPRWLGELGVLGAIGSYVLAVGLQPSVVRAGIAGALASLAWLASRPRDRWYFLLVAAAALLAWNPYNLLEPGFQLSFAAVGAIFVLVPRIERRLEGYPVPRLLATPVAVSTACGLCTAPLLWLDFGRVPVYSVLANALAEPAMPFLLGLGLVSALVHPLVPAVAEALAWLNGWFAAYLAWCARLVGGLPHSQVSSIRALFLLADAGVLAWTVMKLRRPRLRRAGELCGAGLALGLAWRLLG
ncbi:MAG: ComEC/Rec2 family competence protein, partial [Actinobacteria bacterium]|nr:ComEC/Rec2 family competence protein [Actinomycetota bacterium]